MVSDAGTMARIELIMEAHQKVVVAMIVKMIKIKAIHECTPEARNLAHARSRN